MIRRGFLKLAVRESIHSCGGIAGGERVTGLGSSQVGRWNNRNDQDLPGLEHALSLDEAALACGGRAAILQAMASQLGHVAIELPQGVGDAEAVAVQLARATAEFGDIARAVTDALSDNHIDGREEITIAARIDEALSALMVLRSLVIEDERNIVKRGAFVRSVSDAAKSGS